MYVRNTCGFDSAAQIILTRMFSDEETVTIVKELSGRNLFFNFICNIYASQNVTAENYMERLSIMQRLPSYKNCLVIKKDDKDKDYGLFEALTNIGGIVAELLGDTAPSIMFTVEACNNSHAAYSQPARTLNFSTQLLIRAPILMRNVLNNTIESFTSEFSMCDCNVRGCDKLRKRNFVYSGKFAIIHYKTLTIHFRQQNRSFELILRFALRKAYF